MVDLEKLKKASIVALDFETNGEPGKYLKMDLFSYAYMDGKKIEAVADTKDMFPQIWEIIKDKKIVMHNAKYDLSVLRAEGLEYDKVDYEDSMIMAHLLDENRRKGLKELRQTLLGKPERAKWKDIDKTDMVAYKVYAAADAEDTLEVYNEIIRDIKDEGLEIVYELEKQAILPVMDMEYGGIKIDVDLLYEQDIKLKDFILDLAKKINNNVPGNRIDIGSAKQLSDLFFNRLQIIPLAKWHRKTLISTDIETLTFIANGTNKLAAEIAGNLIEWRKFKKLQTAFTEGLKNKIDKDGFIYPKFNASGARTGRYSSSTPNMQQVPRTEFVKDDPSTNLRALFLPEDGRYIITADYSQIELRMMAELSKDRLMCQAFREGLDLHDITAQTLGISRHHAKTLNFGIGYGMGPGAFAVQTGMNFNEAATHIQTFWENYSGLAHFMDTVKRKANSLGYVRTISGRKRRFIYEADNVDRQACNTIIQGSSADLMKIALVYIYRSLDRKRSRILMTVHDEISISVDKDYAREAKEITKYCMENALKFTIPIIVEPKVGRRWSDNK